MNNKIFLFFHGVENIVFKGENTGVISIFSLFTIFSKAFKSITKPQDSGIDLLLF